ncbi:MAG: hypothetical protein DMF66_07525 [Acidobacteria bacterium]|nr:MAG: hypothetical protein DMF66_07525 [Acidobacteriota bacterium]
MISAPKSAPISNVTPATTTCGRMTKRSATRIWPPATAATSRASTRASATRRVSKRFCRDSRTSTDEKGLPGATRRRARNSARPASSTEASSTSTSTLSIVRPS